VRRRRAAGVLALGAAGALLAPARPAGAAPPPAVYAISIGQNEIPARLRNSQNEGLAPLRYADDDATYFYDFMRGLSRQAFLLSVLDADTQRRFPDLARVARVPTKAALTAVVTELGAAMAGDRAAGRDPVLVVFYSGHGVRDERGAPALALYDGALDQAWLYEEVLAKLPARFTHLIVDSCHAEAVVRPRDAEARTEVIAEAERQSYLEAGTLARFPQVGALLASTAGAQSFEWDTYRGGVFAHEVLSGLRGAADVNGDGLIEYSEIAAFVAAANLEIADARIRPHVVVLPPRADRRAPIVDLSGDASTFRLKGLASGPWATPFFVEDTGGVRVLDAFPERDAPISYRLPAGEPLYLVGPDGEVELAPTPGGVLELDGVGTRRPATRARGALESSMRRGLFATPFGPSFYRGYVSHEPELVPVTFAARRAPTIVMEAPAPEPAPPSLLPPPRAERPNAARRTVGTALLAGGGVAAVVAGTFALAAWSADARYQSTSVERPASQAFSDFERDRAVAIGAGIAAVVLAAAGAAALTW